MRVLIAGLLAFGGLFAVVTIPAGAEATITPEKIERIKNHCTENQATLNRLHQTDAFLRTNRGELYRTISDKLMVPLNRRLASNQLDAGSLLTITADFNSEYSKFFDAYIRYDNSMSKLLSIDCNRQPVSFYNALLDARKNRTELSNSNQAILDLIRSYGIEFTAFKNNYESNE
jgi:hypothetical protein